MAALLQGAAALRVTPPTPMPAEATRQHLRGGLRQRVCHYHRHCVRIPPVTCLQAVWMLQTAARAAAYLAGAPGNILLATGAKELARLCGRLDPARLYPRVLPTHGGHYRLRGHAGIPTPQHLLLCRGRLPVN